MTEAVFVIGDGDDIRKRIESYLLNGDLERLGAFSLVLTESIREIAQLALSAMESNIIFAGGDDIFFITTLRDYREEKIRALMAEFSRLTECSISFGIGPSVELAFINLRRAKAKGPGSLVVSGLPETRT
jgi:hypothetical protein